MAEGLVKIEKCADETMATRRCAALQDLGYTAMVVADTAYLFEGTVVDDGSEEMVAQGTTTETSNGWFVIAIGSTDTVK